MGDPDNAALDALFLRSTNHPGVRVELCREMLEAELFTLVPRAQVDGAEAGELVKVEAPAEMPVGVTSFDYGDPEHGGVMRSFVPFYAAPGHRAPPVAGK